MKIPPPSLSLDLRIFILHEINLLYGRGVFPMNEQLSFPPVIFVATLEFFSSMQYFFFTIDVMYGIINDDS